MLSVRRPMRDDVERYVAVRRDAEPTMRPTADPPPGFRRDRFSRVIGSSVEDFQRAAMGLEVWAAHRGSGIDVFPADVPPTAGSTVGIRTRQLGLWVVAACRVESVIDELSRRGFVYSTLPDHPECGYESFVVRLDGDEVVFDIEAVSKPGMALVRAVAPLTRELQRRASEAYLDALETHVRSSAQPGAT